MRAQVAALEASKVELSRKLATAEASLKTRPVSAADPPLELQRAVTAALAERDGTPLPSPALPCRKLDNRAGTGWADARSEVSRLKAEMESASRGTSM